MAYGSSKARGRMGAAAVSPHHNNPRSEPPLRPTACDNRQILNPLSEARDRTCILMDASQVCFRCATMETPPLFLLPCLCSPGLRTIFSLIPKNPPIPHGFLCGLSDLRCMSPICLIASNPNKKIAVVRDKL